MIKGLWGTIKLVCGCHNDRRVEMGINDRGQHSLFYSCPLYYPENRKEGERACANRINLVDYERMLNHLSDVMMQAVTNKEACDLTNYKWKDKKSYITFEVLKHTDEELVIKMISPKALR